MKTLILLVIGASAALSEDTIALVRERDARAVRMEHREVKEAQPAPPPPTPEEIAAALAKEAAKLVMPKELK